MMILLAREMHPRVRGPFAVLGGVALILVPTFVWLANRDAAGLATSVAAVDWLFPSGALLVGHGGRTWPSAASPSEISSSGLGRIRDAMPVVAIVAAALVVVAGPGSDGMSSLRTGLLAVVAATGLRQLVLSSDRRAVRLRDQRVLERQAQQALVHAGIRSALAGMELSDAPARLIEAICERLARGTGACASAIILAPPVEIEHLFLVPEEGWGAEAVERVRLALRGSLQSRRDGLIQASPADLGLLLAYAPIVADDRTVGCLMLSWTSTDDQSRTQRQMVAEEAAAAAGGLLAHCLRAADVLATARAAVEELIVQRAFHPVFQPIQNLATGQIVGFEALTRFQDGTRPDVMFDRAHAAGCGVELEVATIVDALAGAGHLPADAYLSVNVSPALASQPEALGRAVRRATRDLVLEITEHVPVEDYELMIATLYALDLRVRIAVDDAGAGYAGLSHILALRPHIVKLDAVLIRGIDVDPARQALVEALVGFARRTGTTTIGEGIETEGELAALRSFGVQLGQGYLLGRPQRGPYSVASAETGSAVVTS